jgi:hypothetical protein
MTKRSYMIRWMYVVSALIKSDATNGENFYPGCDDGLILLIVILRRGFYGDERWEWNIYDEDVNNDSDACKT